MAGTAAALAGVGKFLTGTGKDAVKSGFDLAKNTLLVGVPMTSLAAAYMVSRLLSPSAVKDNLNDIVINANEETNLAEGLRDLARLKARKRMQSTAKIHDQFV
jgi:hypothetical protein